MELYPAIDVHNGKVVRASRTSLARATVYHDDPIELALEYAAAGAAWLHVVDLDRAFGAGDQTGLIAAMVKRLDVPVQLGGALWRTEDVERMRDIGVQRVLLGARAAADRRVLDSLAEQFSTDSLGIALDISGGALWGRNWPEASRYSPLELARAAREAGITVVAVTDLSKEGSLQGADVEGAAQLGRDARVDVLISGGVGGPGDLVRARDAGLAGAIVGRALYEGRLTLSEALACCR